MSPSTQLCPYCGIRPRTSDDHIFPEFLGGQTTIRACKPCNDLFGHAFEGRVSSDFAPIVVMFRRGGLHSPRRVVWKYAMKKEGVDYDLDSDLQSTPSKPSIERDETGAIKRGVFAGLQAAKSFIRGLEAQGMKLTMTSQTVGGIDIRKVEFKLNIGMEVRRLAIKLAISAADHLGFSDGLMDNEIREFLLGNTEKSNRVRVDYTRHAALEKIRTPLSHFVFVKGNGKTYNTYAIVQFYGLLQFYVLLNEGAFAHDDFAIAAALDVAKGYREHFEQTELLMFPVAPVNLGRWQFQQLQSDWMKKWNAEAQAVLQDDAKIVSLGLTDRV
jgi:hypothetical protein